MVFVCEIAWLLLGVFSCWQLGSRVVGRIRRWIGFTICAGVFFAPVAWVECRWFHWQWLQPRIGEPLPDVVSRLGAAEPGANGEWTIAYSAPHYWILPQFGLIRIRADSAGHVGSWDVTWR